MAHVVDRRYADKAFATIKMPPAPDASTKVQWRLEWDGSMVVFGPVGQAIMSHHEQTYLIFPQHPYIAHSRGWTAEDMEQNVVMVHQSDELNGVG